jgi:hypothetical protein
LFLKDGNRSIFIRRQGCGEFFILAGMLAALMHQHLEKPQVAGLDSFAKSPFLSATAPANFSKAWKSEVYYNEPVALEPLTRPESMKNGGAGLPARLIRQPQALL